MASPLHSRSRPLLSRVHEEGLEPLVVIHPSTDVEGRVHNGGGVESVSGEELGEGRRTLAQVST